MPPSFRLETGLEAAPRECGANGEWRKATLGLTEW